MWIEKKIPKSIYIHWPFCLQKCSYCDFLSFQQHENFYKQYHDALCNEINSFGSLFKSDEEVSKIRTVYFGGGTPSLYPKDLLKELFDVLHKNFRIEKDVEITFEVNPFGVLEEDLIFWKSLGINRVSVGVQTLNDNVLCDFKRKQSKKDVFDLIAILPKYFENISIDLIVGLPGVMFDEWQKTLLEVCNWSIKHISIYLLTIYENTPLYYKVKNGEISLPDEDMLIEMYEYTVNFLAQKQILQYEISNFATLGYESRHNLVYWDHSEYVGFGLGASSFDGNRRSVNLKNFTSYLNRYKIFYCLEKNLYIPHHFYDFVEFIDDGKKKTEKLMLGLRKTSGMDLHSMLYFLNEGDRAAMMKKIDFLKESGLIEFKGTKISLTLKGMMLEEEVVLNLVRSVNC